MSYIELSNNNGNNTNTDGGLLGQEFVKNFLVFMETDSHGAIGKEQPNYYIPIRSFLNMAPFALNFYKEFIKTSEFKYWPDYDELINMINRANLFSSFAEKSQQFCFALWGYMHH